MGYLDSLWSYIQASSPFLLLGFFMAGLIHSFIPVEKVKKWLGNNKISSIFKASALGVPLPLCSCSVIPTAISLKKSGASNASTAAFLISTPETGVDSISVTYALIDLPMTIIRPIAGFLSASLAGLLNHFFNQEEYKIEEEKKSCCSKNKVKTETSSVASKFKSGIAYGFVDIVDDIAFWLTVGLLLGALIDFILPPNFFVELSPWLGRVSILAIGIPLYICASATTPVAASLIIKGISPGTALMLLLVGPATNISNIAVLQQYIGKKGVFLNILALIVSSVILSYATDFIYYYLQIPVTVKLSHFHQHAQTSWVSLISSCILIILLIKSFWKNYLFPKFLKTRTI